MRQTFAALVTAHRLGHAWMSIHNYACTTANVTCPLFPDRNVLDTELLIFTVEVCQDRGADKRLKRLTTKLGARPLLILIVLGILRHAACGVSRI